MFKKACFISLLAMVWPALLSAKLVLPSLFQTHMVLQQKENVKIWGWDEPGKEVWIKPSWDKPLSVKAGSDGSWQASLKTLKAGSGYSVVISDGKDSIQLNDVLFGEVWLCSGQSNMNFPLQKQERWKSGVINYEREIAEAQHPQIRFFTVEQKVAGSPQKDCAGKWEVCSPQTAGNFSAVAYYFARELESQLHVPVGIIHSSWGGTPVEAWTKHEVLASDADFQPILERYKAHSANPEKAEQDYKKAMDQWRSGVAAGKLKGIAAVQSPREPLLPESNKSPSNLYNAMIAPLIPFTIKGVLWYQGESNTERAYQYRKLFPAMIKGWREDWNIEFPFYFVQIAPHRTQHPELREAQLLTYKSTANTGMAVITDAGDSTDIHPRNKEIVGKRLSLWALARTYGKKIECSGPVYQSMKVKNGKVELSFSHARGLKAVNDDLKEFVIAGEDRTFHPAKARIKGKKVVVWNDNISQPAAVRFGWRYVPHAELYNAAELPASPFRTDNWPGETENNR